MVARLDIKDSFGQGVFITVNELFFEGLKAGEFKLTKRARLENGGERRSVLRGRGMEFFESRPYVMQDEMRSIDWKVSARRQGLYTKIFVEEKDRPIFLVVDFRKPMFFGSTVCFKSVLAAKIAARIASAAINGGDRVGALILGGQVLYSPEARSQKSLAQLFGAMAQASYSHLSSKTAPASLSWLEVSRRLTNRVSKGAQIFLLSDFFGLDDETRPFFARIRKKADIFALKIVDPLEEKLPSLGSVGMSYEGQSIRFDSSNKTLQKNYRAFYNDEDKKLERLFSSLAIPLMRFSTAVSPDLGLRRIFSGRW